MTDFVSHVGEIERLLRQKYGDINMNVLDDFLSYRVTLKLLSKHSIADTQNFISEIEHKLGVKIDLYIQ